MQLFKQGSGLLKNSLKYYFAILKVLTIYRIVNLILLHINYSFSRVFKKRVTAISPFAITIETVRGCNLTCNGCPAGLIKGNEIKCIEPDLFKKTLENVSRKTFYLQLWFQGEPLLHNKLDELIMYAEKKRMFTVLATNGVLLTESVCEMLIRSRLQKLILSIDVAGRSNNYYVGGNYARSIENIKILDGLKKKYKTDFPFLEAQMVVTSENEHLIESFKNDVKKAGADFAKIKSVWFSDLKEKGLPVPSRYSRYTRNLDGTLTVKKPVINKCFRIFSTVVVGYNGDIVPCCFDKKCSYVMGNVSNEPIMSIWKSPKFNEFRGTIFKNRKGINICNNCLS